MFLTPCVAPVQLGPWSNCGTSSARAHFWRLHVNISSFGANHSSRPSRVPSCTQTMPEPSFTLRQFLLLLYSMITISEFHHCSADNLVRPQEVEVLVYLVKSKDLNAMPYLAPCGKRHNLAQIGVVAPK